MSPRSQNVPRAAGEGYILTEGGHDYMYPEVKHGIIALVSFCCTLITQRKEMISPMPCSTDSAKAVRHYKRDESEADTYFVSSCVCAVACSDF